MYTCGPTVWNYPHIGNYRTFLFEDLLRRFLKYRGFKVIQVMNITDVDDRIIKTCNEQGLDLKTLTEKYTRHFFEDLDYLRFERAEFYPLATDHIPEMVRIVLTLMEKGFAYRGEDGSIYYKISKFPSYGALSGLDVRELKPGARVRQDDYTKDSAEDFALWKSWDEADGKIFWETELGKGRPGWHIECSAMSMKYLGDEFDIHTGGVDNIFPHHENEIAQSEAYTGKKFARYWLHSEHLLINEEKMAKRLGNFLTVPDLRKSGIEGAALRFLLLSAKYRTQLNFTEKGLEQATSSVKRINEFAYRLEDAISHNESESSQSAKDLVKATRAAYLDALEDDLDTPRALATVFDFITKGNKLLDREISGGDAKLLREFLIEDFDRIFSVVDSVNEHVLPPGVKAMLEERDSARRTRNFSRADELRKKLLEAGIEVQDTTLGQKWRRVRGN